jgi:polar amino acid transport system substrate-binding protein
LGNSPENDKHHAKEGQMKRTAVVVVLTVLMTLTFSAFCTAGPVLDRILARGELIVGTTGTQPPLTFKNKAGEIDGLDADLAKSMAAAMGLELRFSIIPFSELLPALKAGKVDVVISGMSMTPERNLRFAFVGPYYISGKGVLTKEKNVAALAKADGLNNSSFKVVTLKNSTSQALVEEAAPKARLIPVESYDKAVEMVVDGRADVLIADLPFCALKGYQYKDKGLIAGEAPLTYEPLAIAFTEDPLLENWLNNFLMLLQGSGQLDFFQEKWFDDGSWIADLP